MNVNAFLQKDYENKPPSLPKKQSQSKLVLSAACPERSQMVRMGQFPKGQNKFKIACRKIRPHPKKRKKLRFGIKLDISINDI